MKLAGLPDIPHILAAAWQNAQAWYDNRYHTTEWLHDVAQSFLPPELFEVSDIDPDSHSFTIRISGIPSGNVPRSVEIMSVISHTPIRFRISGENAPTDLTGSQATRYLNQWMDRALGTPETAHALVLVRH